MTNEIDSSYNIQTAAMNLFLGAAPERVEDLNCLWSQYSPQFNLKPDDDGIVMRAGAYKYIEFNNLTMRAFWLASFIAWEGYHAVCNQIDDQHQDYELFNSLLDTFQDMICADDPDSVLFPENFPEPGKYPDPNEEPEKRAAAELATIAVAWAFLHELKHIQLQQDGTSSVHKSPDEMRNEEMCCDCYATEFLLKQIESYGAMTDENVEIVRQKRELGIYFALFALTLLQLKNWSATDSHPAVQNRINEIISQFKKISSDRDCISDACAFAAFAALKLRYSDAPGL